MMNAKTFKTGKGTDLPLLNLKGKDYLEVKYRLVWFREEHPAWSIETSFVTIGDRNACARAEIKDESGRTIATSHKNESASHFPDFMEKAETGAIGRALALIGYGTQFCADELDEGERIVDSPISKRPASQRAAAASESAAVPGLTRATSSAAAASNNATAAEQTGVDVGEYRVTFGKKYLGKRIKDIPRDEIESYLEWLEDNAAKKNLSPTYEVVLLKNAVDRFYHPEKYTTASPSSEPQTEAEAS